MSDVITIVSGDVVPTTSDGRPLAPRSRTGAVTAIRVTERSVEEVKTNLSRFVSQVGDMIDAARSEMTGYVLETVEVAAEITGEGKVGFMGTGVNVGGSTSLTILFRRKSNYG